MNTHRIFFAIALALVTSLSSLAMAQPLAQTVSSQTDDTDLAQSDSSTDAHAAKERAEVRKRIEFLLSGYEYFPSRAELEKLAPAPVLIALLEEMTQEADLRPTLRLRAIDALSLFDGDDVRPFLLAILATNLEEVPSSELRVARLMRHRAINSIARLDKEASVDALMPFLDDADLQIRLTTVSALGQFAGLAGKKALEDLKKKDTHPAVQREINKYL